MSGSDLHILVDWFKALRKRLKRIEFLAALNFSAILGYLFSANEGETKSTIVFFMVVTILFFAIKEIYIWWSNWRAFRAADKIKEAIYKGLEEE